ncbi:hypothetical protein CcrColossus_gp024 [Caulobacter phage CcrColossus]|uniref:Uncharacterized protein n=1 Tax=Caulobacter phage CcrColossus TaxID=1211640 RepID=K4JRH1_9CAUD|nr:hypothetical protein CcrColossus_gp024 [Caulobacter phage CcrColossus]AFU87894.1 hypothetical protein CcrColossus_gp024 [Caulobacter phage CcrColossus]
MTSQLCIADENAALDFLARAVPALCDAGIMPPTLDILDSLAANPNAYGLSRVPTLAPLAAEWAGPYQTQANDGEGPTTVRALIVAALGADESGNFDIGFRTYAVNDTEHWNLAGTPLEGVPAYSLYLIREGEQTYMCSLTPSSYAYGIQNVFLYPDQEGLPAVNEYGQTAVEAYMDAENPEYEAVEDTYFGYMGDREALDRREAEEGDVSERLSFDKSVFRVDLSTLDGFAASPANPRETTAFADFETLAAAFYKAACDSAWEDAKEYVSGNATEPRILTGC